jgi:hypothetical protein
VHWQGESLLDVASKTTRAVAAEYAQYTDAAWSSKGMLELIRRKMSAAALSSPDKPSTSTSSPIGLLLAPSAHVFVGAMEPSKDISLV